MANVTLQLTVQNVDEANELTTGTAAIVESVEFVAGNGGGWPDVTFAGSEVELAKVIVGLHGIMPNDKTSIFEQFDLIRPAV